MRLCFLFFMVSWWLYLSSCTRNLGQANNNVTDKTQNSPSEQNDICAETIIETKDTIVGEISLSCQKKEPNKIPLLFARQFPQSSSNSWSLLDMFNQPNSIELCAPGPFIIKSENQRKPNEEQIWHFENSPQLFVWLQTGINNQEVQFSLTDGRGMQFPLQMFQLNKEEYSTFILKPTEKIPEGKLLYISLKSNSTLGKEKIIWLQAFMVKINT